MTRKIFLKKFELKSIIQKYYFHKFLIFIFRSLVMSKRQVLLALLVLPALFLSQTISVFADESQEDLQLSWERVKVALLDGGINFDFAGDPITDRVEKRKSFIQEDIGSGSDYTTFSALKLIKHKIGDNSSKKPYRSLSIFDLQVRPGGKGQYSPQPEAADMYSVIKGLEWIVDYNENHEVPIQIAFLPLSKETVKLRENTGPIDRAIRQVTDSGTLLITPAGNHGKKLQFKEEGQTREIMPAQNPLTLTVSGVHQLDQPTFDEDSNIGNQIDLLSYYVDDENTTAAALNATRAASRVVADAHRQGKANLSPDQLEKILLDQAKNLNNLEGYQGDNPPLKVVNNQSRYVKIEREKETPQQEKGYTIDGNIVKYHFDLDLRKDQYTTLLGLKEVLYDIFTFDLDGSGTPFTMELEETEEKVTGLVLKGPAYAFGGDGDKPYFYHLVDDPLLTVKAKSKDQLLRDIKGELLKMNNNPHVSIRGIREGNTEGANGHLIFGIKLQVEPEDLK